MGFDSYGKEQSFNAPVSKTASFAYSTALNYLLAKESKQKLLIGDRTTTFWAEKEHKFETVFADLFGTSAKDDQIQDAKALIAALRAPQIGVKPELDPQTRFYILGLAPNAARIAVRFGMKERCSKSWIILISILRIAQLFTDLISRKRFRFSSYWYPQPFRAMQKIFNQTSLEI